MAGFPGGATALADPDHRLQVVTHRPAETRDTTVWEDIRYAAGLAGDYIRHDPIVAAVLAATFLGLTVVVGVLTVRQVEVLAELTNQLVARNAGVIGRLAWQSVSLFVLMIGFSLLLLYIRLTLRMRMRTRITARLQDRWLADNRFYHLEREHRVDHPEQRIQEDVFIFVQYVVEIAPGLLALVVPTFLFAGKLWTLSPPLAVPLGGGEIVLRGWLFYAIVAFAVAWTYITHRVGTHLTRAEIIRHRLEAQFRQELGLIREAGEAIAFEGGATLERARVDGTFGLIRANWRTFTWSSISLQFITTVPNSAFMIAPTLVCAPFVLAGTMQIGTIALIGAAMQSVYAGFGALIASYQSLALLRSSSSRMRYFEEILAHDVPADIQVVRTDAPAFEAAGLTVAFPDGRPMLALDHVRLERGDRMLISGPSGAGKSTLLRVFAGLWGFGAGEVRLPAGQRISFLPQRPYMPDGTLASLMTYPHMPEAEDDVRLDELLRVLNLATLIPRLHEHAAWKRTLSPGEQQRVALARAVLARPDILFLDEATSALDPESEASAYTLIRERLPDTTIVSVAHREALRIFHEVELALRPQEGGWSAATFRRPGAP